MRSLAVLLSLTLTLPLAAQTRSSDAKVIESIMKNAVKAWNLPGAAIAVVENDRVIFARGYGVKDLAGSDPVTADTLFQIASTSKAFTSAALAMLVSEKKVSWDDPVRKHLDYFRLSDICADRDVTVRDILSHRTGLSRHDELWDDTPLTREEVVRQIGSVELSRPFRSSYQYQNITFIAAGEIVGRASGIPWDEFVRKRIFAPLGMTGTVLSDAEWNAADHATGYAYDWKTGAITVQKPIETTTIGAGGGIKSSARDMAQWLRFQLRDGTYDGVQLVDPEALQETRTPQTVIRMQGLTREANPETNVMAYGFGWQVMDYRGELLVAHAGALNGFRTQVALLPERNIGFVVMTNVGRGLGLIAIRNSLVDLLSGKPRRDWNAYYLMIDRKADEKAEADRNERLSKKIAGTTPSRAIGSYAGEYVSEAYGPASIEVDASGKLILKWSRMTVPLEHFHYDVFIPAAEHDYIDEVRFMPGDGAEIESMRLFGETFRKR